MQCSCGKDNAPNAKFCKGCGAPVQVAPVVTDAQVKSCPGCTAQLKLNAKFCGKCGHQFDNPVDSPDSAPQSEPQAAAPIEQVMPKQVAIEPAASVVDVNPALVEAQRHRAEPMQPAHVAATPSAKVAVTSGDNKKLIVIAAVLFMIAAVAGTGWYFILAPNNETAVTEAIIAQAPVDAVATPLPQSSVTPVTEAPVAGSASPTASYLGKTTKEGATLDGYTIEPVDQTKNFKILQGFDDNGRKLILVTDMTGNVVDAKNIPEVDKAFMSSKQACILNKKPYAGVYVAASFEKLAPPSSIWKLTEDGKLADETVENLECAAYSECEPESDVCFNVGYNDKRKQALAKQAAVKQATAKPKVQAKKEPAQKSVPSNATQHHNQSTPEPAQESEAVQQQEATSEEPNKKKRGLGGLFEKLGESVKNGATEATCTSAQRAMNQCN